MNNPVATYRLQFNSTFTFTQFEQVIGYLQKLGVSTIYASPVFGATPGSTHGYDGVDPHHINAEIGTIKQLRNISSKLKANNIGWLQDIVPNHMGFHQTNPWLMDLFEKGKRSLYTNFFDAVWTSQLFKDEPIMVPFLGKKIDEVIADNKLSIKYLSEKGLLLEYFDDHYPLNPPSYITFLQNNTAEQPRPIQLFIKNANALQYHIDAGTYALKWTTLKQKFARLWADEVTAPFLQQCVDLVQQDKDLIKQIADQQYYRLCNWQETESKINYRRFFTVNGLICLNIQDKTVFSHFHRFIKELVDEGVFQGLRIDHIDGLYDPTKYIDDLRQLTGDDTYIVAEKILEEGEELPTRWALQGTSGYDFLAQVNNLFTNPTAQKRFTNFYSELVNNEQPVTEQIAQKKEAILYNSMAGELENLYRLFKKLRLTDKKILDGLEPGIIRKAIGQLLILCPVYRYYGNQLPLPDDEYRKVKELFKQAKNAKPELKPALNLLEIVVLEKPKLGIADYNRRALQFYQRLMQFSGPLMAKGVEDTLMYTYNRFIGHNEVGDAPEAFGVNTKQFHKLMEQRQQNWPLAINGTSTHDTKRGEDVRARLNVLTDLSKTWLKTVKQWQELNAGLKVNNAPDANDEYFIYQTLTGAYPMPGEDEDNFAERLQEYLTKALREAKTNSNWSQPNEAYEQATLNFAKALLDTQSEFWTSFTQLHEHIADFGIVNSLAQLLLKFTSPGVPDVYQGRELYDLSLVDPDNRRPVDYDRRSDLLNDLETNAPSVAELWNNRYNGQIKLWLTKTLFAERASSSELFAKASYIPLKVKGAFDEYIFAFARRYEQQWYITIVPLHLAELCREQDRTPQELKWRNTRVILPPDAPIEWSDLLNGGNGKTVENSVRIKEVFGAVPMALLKMQQPDNGRGAGVLLHITSLPSPYGVGDLGPEAYRFADKLALGGQKYWQLLPLTPTGAKQSFSPYSSVSSMAGNTLLISPDLLADMDLLTQDDLQAVAIPSKQNADYLKATQIKNNLLSIAYQNFKTGEHSKLQKAFAAFCKAEANWLDDLAIFSVLKQNYHDAPWYEWPIEYKKRKTAVIKRFAVQNEAEVDEIKWQQFLFHQQWMELKTYCQVLNIKMIGDLPLYVSHDSVDVWANATNFSLDADGQMIGMAGVPPDHFSAYGQLWGMPVYRWDVMAASGYKWWIDRLRKNTELFDIVRLDHFRAFSAYWEVPFGETTAQNGAWKAGPGKPFFHAVKAALGKLPFIAEDLGDIDTPVYELRDEFEFPGMKILQFAFGDELAASLYIPHNYQENYLVYTGTHDNNTTLGWFEQETDKNTRKQIEQYTGRSVKTKNIHEVLARVAYSSTAKIAILPIQDVIGLDGTARMNKPSTPDNNWVWRLLPQQFDEDDTEHLLEWVKLYNR